VPTDVNGCSRKSSNATIFICAGHAGGGSLVQFVLTTLELVSWNDTVPPVLAAWAALPSPADVHASTNVSRLHSLTVTFSLVGVGLCSLSVHDYVQVAPFGCGIHSPAATEAERTSAAVSGATTNARRTRTE
jgi:hypothetical protein